MPSCKSRCFVMLFKKYVSLCPETTSSSAFYLQPLSKPTATQWYSAKPLGHNTLSKAISKICKLAGMSGFKTNHSLRVTAATRLYQSGVDEQLIMEKTGHRSLEGVRSYKRTSDEQRESISDILSNRKVPRMDTVAAPTHIHDPQGEAKSCTSSPSKGREVVAYSNTQDTSLQPVTASTMNFQANTKNSLPGSFIFNSCSTVNFNIHYN